MPDGSSPPRTLSAYPWVVVRVDCGLCSREGSYRLARLAAKFGPEMPLDEVLDRIAWDCPWQDRRGNQYVPKCKARFPDLETVAKPPPDLPPGLVTLRLVQGGKG